MRRLIVFSLVLSLVFWLLPSVSLSEDDQAPDSITYLEPDDPLPPLPSEALLEVHFINVGAADAILLRMGALTMLVDSGPKNTADRVLAYCEEIGVDRLDYAFATHPHDDHIGGFLEILKQLPCGEFMQPPFFDDYEQDPTNMALQALLGALEIPVVTVVNNTGMQFGQAELAFYQWENIRRAVNDRSMILRARLGARAVLLAADLESNGQRTHAEQEGQALSADILKMPHHGIGLYTAELHEAVQPQLAIFTNTKKNLENILAKTKRRGMQSMLTPKGTILAVTDGDTWSVWQMPAQGKP